MPMKRKLCEFWDLISCRLLQGATTVQSVCGIWRQANPRWRWQITRRASDPLFYTPHSELDLLFYVVTGDICSLVTGDNPHYCTVWLSEVVLWFPSLIFFCAILGSSCFSFRSQSHLPSFSYSNWDTQVLKCCNLHNYQQLLIGFFFPWKSKPSLCIMQVSCAQHKHFFVHACSNLSRWLCWLVDQELFDIEDHDVILAMPVSYGRKLVGGKDAWEWMQKNWIPLVFS